MEKAFYFQTIIMKLQEFWAERDCLIWQPYYSQVGAGTMNPATYLRVLGPEPWHVAYVEPSIRPDDGRYGDNPNRLQQFYQFQVILKPDPGNPQEVYLDSLQALGIDPAEHDIRFVEDNWQQPAIGAWGLGWEVWLDGQEITQFTYFQQCGGLNLSPVSVELTYGLERIAMALQGVRHFKDIKWSPERTYGDVNLMGEREHSAYYFDVADVDRMWALYEMYELEAERALEAGLVLPAHDYVLKTSHTFNILDTRGAVGVTERQALFGRTRDLARRVAEAYVAQRQAVEFPWMKEGSQPKEEVEKAVIVDPKVDSAPFLLEIGTEELPTGDLASALMQLETQVPLLLEELRLTYDGFQVFGTPRRLVVFVDGLAYRQPDLALEVKGPPAEHAFDPSGKPTRAAEGFARSKGIEVSELVVENIDGGDYVVARTEQSGKLARNVLQEALPELIAGIRFNKSMRWNVSDVAFSRPIRWLLALHGESLVPFEYAGYLSQRESQGLRFSGFESFSAASPKAYFEIMQKQGILLDPAIRTSEIKQQVDALAAEVGGRIPDDPDLLEEVTHLVEKPTAFRGEFDQSYLEALPAEVLVSVMKKHQRYFVVEDSEEQLMPYFIGVRNGGEEHMEIVTDGNEQVILARFDDARFFVQKDLQQPFETYLAALKPLVFQVEIGSFYDKTQRIIKLVESLAEKLNLDAAEKSITRRAAELCKADLATKMVVEMTSLQGVMGRYYALRSGEDPAVAQAIFEHYLPRSARDQHPPSKPGLVVGLADRLDSLVGLFSAGLAPTGTKDPFALRRAAVGLCQNLMAWQLHFDLRRGLSEAANLMPGDLKEEAVDACLVFIQGRLKVMLLEKGFNHDVVDAVLAAKGVDPYGSLMGAESLTTWLERADWPEILPAFSRCVRITRDQQEIFTVDPGCFAEDSESGLFVAVVEAERELADAGDVDSFMQCFLPLVPVINRFFDEVLVMADDLAVRENRLGLLQRVAALSNGIVDLSYLEGF